MTSAVARKYAHALLEVAISEQLEDKVLEDLAGFERLVQDLPQLNQTIANPAIPIVAKREIVKQLAERLSAAQIVTNFLLILLQNARIVQLDECLEAYQEALDLTRGIVRADVFTSRKLDDSVRTRLEGEVSTMTGKQVKLRYHEDESLIGGMKIAIGSKVFDASVRTQLDEIQRRLVSL
jgi:F-type H+-transporting ATPase subunit delta